MERTRVGRDRCLGHVLHQELLFERGYVLNEYCEWCFRDRCDRASAWVDRLALAILSDQTILKPMKLPSYQPFNRPTDQPRNENINQYTNDQTIFYNRPKSPTKQSNN